MTDTIILVQFWHSIAPSIRLNSNIICLFRSSNNTEMKNIRKDLSGSL